MRKSCVSRRAGSTSPIARRGSGTFVRRGDEWHPIRQALLDPGDVLRFGACTITAGELGALCVRADAEPDEGRSSQRDASAEDGSRE